MRYMRTESPYAAQYNAALEAVFPGSTGTVNTAPAVGTNLTDGPSLAAVAQIPTAQPDAATPTDEPFSSTKAKPLAKSQKVGTIKTGSVGDHFDRKIRLTESSDDLKQTNPYYATGEYKWRNNCQRCVPTYELRRRGYNVIAKNLPASIEEDYLARDYTLAWSRRERIWCKQGNGLEQIHAQMEQWGDGSRVEISIVWAGTNNIGHVFVAEQRNGKTYFIDPQNGSVDCSEYFMLAAEGKTNMLRIDNNEPSEKILDCCENRR